MILHQLLAASLDADGPDRLAVYRLAHAEARRLADEAIATARQALDAADAGRLGEALDLVIAAATTASEVRLTAGWEFLEARE